MQHEEAPFDMVSDGTFAKFAIVTNDCIRISPNTFSLLWNTLYALYVYGSGS